MKQLATALRRAGFISTEDTVKERNRLRYQRRARARLRYQRDRAIARALQSRDSSGRFRSVKADLASVRAFGELLRDYQ